MRGAVAVQVERAGVALDHTVPTAPDPDAGAMATTAAGALRGLAFAIEADRLLRHGTAAPTGMQLAEADEARRARSARADLGAGPAVHPHRIGPRLTGGPSDRRPTPRCYPGRTGRPGGRLVRP